jgi:hypothetical protein
MTDLPPIKAIPYDELLALVYRLEAAQEAQRQTLTGRILELEQQVKNLAYRLDGATMHHARPNYAAQYAALGFVVVDDFDLDYVIAAQTDTDAPTGDEA